MNAAHPPEIHPCDKGAKTLPDFISPASRKFMQGALEGVHDDDCDIKIKINSNLSQTNANILLRHIAES